MAKREDADEEKEEYEFIPPDFDEEAFIHKELVSFRSTAILFLWGIIAALLSWALYGPLGAAGMSWLIGLVLMVAFGYGLKFLFPKLKVDVSHWGRREWLGTGFLFFFTWLAFFILFVNPPISDYADPHVGVYASPLLQEAGGDVEVHVFFDDNDHIASRTFLVTGPSGPIEADFAFEASGHYIWSATGLAAGEYRVDATATDDAGHEGAGNTTFSVGSGAVEVTVPTMLDGLDDEIIVDPSVERRDVANVYLITDRLCLDRNDDPIKCQVILKFDENLNAWVARNNHPGWKEGSQNFTVVVELYNRFHAGGDRIDGGELRLEGYSIQVVPDEDTIKVSKKRNPTQAPAVDLPGVGPVAIGIGLLGIAFLARRRQG